MKTIFDLKSEAHMLIDDIRSYGVHDSVIYKRLAFKLGVPQQMAHLGSMATMTQVERAIKALNNMRNAEERRWHLTRPELPKTPKLRKPKKVEKALEPRLKDEVLPLAEQKRLLANLRKPVKRRGLFARFLGYFNL